MSQSAPRPMTGSAAASGRSRTMSGPPPARREMWRRMKLMIRSPVEEDADDVGGHGRQHREGEGHMYEQPQFQERTDADMAAHPRQRLSLLLQQTHDALQSCALNRIGGPSVAGAQPPELRA